MTEYTPTTEDIRYRLEHRQSAPLEEGAFDRWLTADRKAQRAEAVDILLTDLQRYWVGTGDPSGDPVVAFLADYPNPYREVTDD